MVHAPAWGRACAHAGGGRPCRTGRGVPLGTAMRGDAARRDIRVGGVLPRTGDRHGIERQHLTGARGMIAAGGMPEPRVAYLVQPLRQHVLEEAAHELVAVEADRAPARRFAMLVADADARVVEPDDAGLGDGDAEHIARQIAQHRLGTVSPGRAVDDPGLLQAARGSTRSGRRFSSAALIWRVRGRRAAASGAGICPGQDARCGRHRTHRHR